MRISGANFRPANSLAPATSRQQCPRRLPAPRTTSGPMPGIPSSRCTEILPSRSRLVERVSWKVRHESRRHVGVEPLHRMKAAKLGLLLVGLVGGVLSGQALGKGASPAVDELTPS